MIKNKHSIEQLPNGLSTVFSELQVSKHCVKQAFEKALGFHVPIYFSLFLTGFFIKKLVCPCHI